MHHANPFSTLETEPTSRGSIPADNGDLTGSFGVPDPLTISALTVTVVATLATLIVSTTTILDELLVVTVGAIPTLTVATRLNVDDIYIASSGDIALHASLKPDGSETIGVSGTRFTNGYFTSLNVTTVVTATLDAVGVAIDVVGNLVPESTGSHSLGTATAVDRWDAGYIKALHLYDDTTWYSGSSLLPDSTTTANNGTIGDATHFFKEAYLADIFVVNLKSATASTISVDHTLDMDTGALIDFNDTSGGAGASGGYVNVMVAGIAKRIEYFAVS